MDSRTHPPRMGGVRRLLQMLLLTQLLTVTIAAGFVSRAQAAEPGVGLREPNAAQIANVTALGTHWVRMFATWPDLEPARGVFAANWFAKYEQIFAQLPAGTKVILDVVGTPRWETGSSNQYTPPANPNEYAAFVGALAQRWAGRVSAYEIWNEEDSSSWWAGGPDPAAYAQLLKATYPVVKAADPNATVLIGGLTGNDYQFVEGVYQAGAKGSFDAVGVHTDTACNVQSPYIYLRGAGNRIITDAFLAYREVHAVMLANGDNKPIWMTELSWRTTSAVCSEGAFAGQKPEGVTPEEQATFLRQAYHCMAQDPYVQVALWFPLQDEGRVSSGLLRTNGSQKPAFAAMRAYAREGDQLTEPCGVFTGPKITVLSPGNHRAYTGPLPIHVFATSSVGVFRIRLEIDGKLIRNYDGPSFPQTLSGAIDWIGAPFLTYGNHRLTFTSTDKEKNIARTTVIIDHVRSLGASRAPKGHTHRSKRHTHKAKRHARRHKTHAHRAPPR